MNSPRLSIVIPVFNEQESLPRLYARLRELNLRWHYSWELLFVDDGSGDDSLRILKELKERDEHIKIVELDRNYGQHAALAAGFAAASGEIIITLDADLQTDPLAIPEFIRLIESGHDFVSGIRRGSADSWIKRRLPSKLLNYLIGKVTGKPLADYGCPMNAMRSEIARALPRYGYMQRFFKPLAVRLAQNIGETEVAHQPRVAGESKYDFMALVDLFFDFVTNFSKQLFQRLALLGFFFTGVSSVAAAAYLSLRILGLIQAMERLIWAVFLSFTFGFNLIILGVLGDFVIRTYRKLEGKPLYEIRNIW